MSLGQDKDKGDSATSSSTEEQLKANATGGSGTNDTEDDSGEISGAQFPSVVELNVGGQVYTTALSTLTRDTTSLLGIIFSGKSKTPPLRDTRGRYFLDRDGHLFRYILDYLRNTKLVLPEDFSEKDRLQVEAEYYRLPGLVESVRKARGNTKDKDNVGSNASKAQVDNAKVSRAAMGTKYQAHLESSTPQSSAQNNNGGGYITVGYRGTFAFGRDGLADVQFRKLMRIIVCGKVSLCREAFKETLNESRDPDRGQGDRYTSRFFLKHNFLEQAFDMLLDAGFSLTSACATPANNTGTGGGQETDTEEARWLHYNEFVFYREATE